MTEQRKDSIQVQTDEPTRFLGLVNRSVYTTDKPSPHGWACTEVAPLSVSCTIYRKLYHWKLPFPSNSFVAYVATGRDLLTTVTFPSPREGMAITLTLRESTACDHGRSHSVWWWSYSPGRTQSHNTGKAKEGSILCLILRLCGNHSGLYYYFWASPRVS